MNRARGRRVARRACGIAAVAVCAVAGACHRAAPATAPLPTPPGEPPSVRAPVESAPVGVEPGAGVGAVIRDPQLRRFDVVAVGESTFTILAGGERWVRRGVTGVAVDPRRRDALVARFRVIARVGDSATALVTGQTTRLVPTHVALLREPVPGPLRQDAFWAGLFFGLAAGIAGVLAVKR